VYIAGGVASRLGKLFDAQASARHSMPIRPISRLLASIPIMDDEPQRAGAARLRGAGG